MAHCTTHGRLKSVPSVKIAIRSMHSDCYHLGVLCVDTDVKEIIHLMRHYELSISDKFDSYKYVDIKQFTELDQTHMLTQMRALFEQHEEFGLPYGPCGGGSFSSLGEFIGNVGDGFTCSSFVLEFFKSQGYSFIDDATWPKREEDEAWQKELLFDFNQKYGRLPEDIEHFDEQLKKVGALRFRPQEVAASVTFDSYNIDYEQIIPISKEIQSELSD